ncbi:hypothetical protein KAR91_85270 [Candidatus Pacearchaeota archaeon]|nr:hypothetical protein [Candidatus Pacearchaeota archaeon]
MKPSVTELLNLLDKPGLLHWANKIGLEGIQLKEYRKKCLAKGTSLHKQTEAFIDNGVAFEKEENQKNCVKFLSNIKVLDVESKIETDHYLGRYDIRYERDGEIFIGDFKSSSGIYLENVLQLIAYSMAEDIDNISIIEIPSFKEKIITVKDRQPFIEILKSLSIIHEMKELATWSS